MSTKIFVNLPVRDLDRSMAFFKTLGFSFNPHFTDATAACMVIAEDIYAMLLTHQKFEMFATRPISDAHKSTEVLTALSFESKERVDEIVGKAVAAGGHEARKPQDHGFMYTRTFDDPDGHVWEIFWMDPAFARQSDEPGPAAA